MEKFIYCGLIAMIGITFATFIGLMWVIIYKNGFPL